MSRLQCRDRIPPHLISTAPNVVATRFTRRTRTHDARREVAQPSAEATAHMGGVARRTACSGNGFWLSKIQHT
eukprot:671142-Pyramimonas_sp.AAC.1